MLGSLQSRERTLNGQLDVAKTKTQKEFLQQDNNYNEQEGGVVSNIYDVAI